MFWPQSTDSDAAHALRQLVYRLRQKGIPVESSGEAISISVETVSCDARDLLNSGLGEHLKARLPAGELGFLPHFAPDISEAYQSWLEETRARVRLRIVRTQLRLLAEARRDGSWNEVEQVASSILSLDPLNEAATMAMAESAAMTGSKASALELLDNYARELGLKAETIGLPARALRRRIAERPSDWQPVGSSEVRLVGRRKEVALLSTLLDDAKDGRGQSVVLMGPAGIGKTRLLTELARLAQLKGVLCIAAGATPPDRAQPMSTAARLAKAVVDAPGAVGASPEAFGILRRFTTGGPAVSVIEALAAGPTSIETISWAITDALSAVSVESSTLLHCDDLHHADDLSLAIIARVAKAAPANRLLMLGASRAPLTPEREHAGREGWCRTESIAPLSPSSAQELVLALVSALGISLNESDSDAIARASGGNPLFLRELTTNRREDAHSLALPPGLSQVIEQRLADLTSAEIRVLRRLATLGSLATHSRLRSLEAATAHELPELIERLESQGIVSSENGGQLTMHECWLHGVRARMGGAVAATIALEVAELLASEPDTADSIDARWRASDLFAVAGDHARARATYLATGSALLRRGATRSAVVTFDRAFALSPEGPLRLEAAASLAVASHVNGDLDATHRICSSVLDELHHNSAEAYPFEALLLALYADSAHLLGRDASVALNRAESCLQRTTLDGEVCQQVCLYVLRTLLADSHSERTRRILTISRQAASRSTQTIFGALTELVVAAEHGSRVEAHAADELLAAFPTSALPPGLRTLTLRYRCVNLRFLCEHEAAARLAQEAIRIATSHGLERERRAAQTSLAFLCLDLGQLSEASDWIGASRDRTRSTKGSEEDRSLTHAEGRLLLHREMYEDCLRHYEAIRDRIALDSMTRRRAVDQACIALATIKCGRADDARELLDDLERTAIAAHPSAQFDFVIDCLLRAFEHNGEALRARRLASAYATARSGAYDRPVVPVLGALAHALCGGVARVS